MTQQIIDVGANANDGTGEPLRQAFTAVNDNFTQIWAAGPVGTNVKISGNIVTTTVTNLGLTLAGNGIGNIQANSTIVPGTSGVYDLGAPDRTFQYIYGDYFVGNGALLTGIVANTSYNDSNVAAFLPTYTGNLVSLTGPVITTSNITGGNIVTSGVVSAAGNITGGNTITGNSLRSLGTISAAGNITTAANVSANYFIGNGALLTGITATNISAAALTGTTLSSNVLYSSLKVVDDLLYLDVVGNITTTGQFIGSGAGITDIPAANVSGQVANALVAGTVYNNTQPNITSVGVLTSLTATGNISGNYFIGNGALLTGIAATNVNANALVGDTLSANVLYSSLKVVDDLLYLDVVGNITTTGRFIGSGAGLINIPGANVSGTVANAAYATAAGTAYSIAGANVSGTVANAAYAITAGTAATANTATTATYADTANTVAGANVSGTVANAAYATTAGSATTATTATTAGTVTSAAQPNITSVGTLTSVAISGNATAGNILTSGRISAVGNITGNYFIGNGSLLTGVLATNVNANALVGNTLSSNVLYSSLKVVDDLLYLDVVGNITTTGQFVGSGAGLTTIPGANITGTVANAAYATVAGTVASNAQPNITSVGTLTSLSSSGNITANYFIGNGSQLTEVTAARVSANALTGNTLSANVLNSSLVSVGNLNGLSVIGNTTGGNFFAQGQVSASGNITGNYFIGNGSQLTGIVASNIGVLSNLSVTGNTTTGNLLSNGSISAVGNIRTVGNVSGNYFIGNGALLTGITVAAGTAIVNGNSNVNVGANGNVTVSTAGVSNVAVFDPTGVSVAGLISATGNVTGNYLLGNGAFITGLPAGYSNADVANYLPTYSGNLVSLTGPVITTANITGGNLLTAGQVSAAGNVSGNYFIGNGSQLTGVAASSANANALVGTTLSSNVLYSSLTQVGTLANLTVTANIAGGNVLTGGTVSAAGNIIGGNIVTSGSGGNISGANVISGTTLSATANVIGGNIVTAGVITATGEITSAANVTGSNLVTSGLVTVSGNITGGNVLTGGLISATGNVIGGNVNTSNIQPLSGALTISTASGNLNLQPAGNVVLSNTVINSVAYPQQDTDAATKQYVDNAVSTAISYHQPVVAATISTLDTATGGTVTYSQPNGAGNGVGALLTTTGSFNLIDTANVQTVGTRILVKNEANAVFNGVYTWANATNLIRATDADTYGAANTAALGINDYFFVTNGNVNLGSAYVVSAPVGTITFGTSNIAFAQFSSSQTYTANTNAGLSLIGTVFSAKVDQNTTAFDGSGNIVVKAGANLTTPNIGAATGTSISLTGNVTGGNVLTGGIVSATANIIGGNVLTGGIVSATANIIGGNVLTAGLISATSTITSAANISGGNVLTGGLVSATGNVYGNAILSDNYFYANGVPIPTGIVYTASTSPPAGPDLADQWYDTANDVLYEYISDGTSQYWVDVNSPAFAGGVVANVAISGSMIPNANLVYNIGSPSTVFNTAYINTVNVSASVNSSLINVGTLANATAIVLQTNGANAISIDGSQNLTFANRLRANAMPVGAVVQTVMSSALGGSITNSTSYVDISSATVTITPSSATSKILILATGTSSFTSVSGANVTADTQLVRSPTTSLQIQNYESTIAGGGIGGAGAIAYSYQDSPGTTSAVTYKLQQKISNASSTLTSTNIWLIAMEIAA